MDAPKQGSRAVALIDGSAVDTDSFTAVGALSNTASSGALVRCTATLIAPSVAVTAAHCVTGVEDPASMLRFAMGTSLKSAVAAEIPLRAVVVHPDWSTSEEYSIPNEPAQLSDIALVELETPLTDVTAATPASPSDADAKIVLGAQVHVVGYGRTSASDRDSDGEKQYGVSFVSDVGSHEFRIDGLDATQKCNGDSGSPTFVHIDDDEGSRYLLVGFASRTDDGCVNGSIETRIDPYIDWISQQYTLPCGSGTAADCVPAAPLETSGCATHGTRNSLGRVFFLALLMLYLGVMRIVRNTSAKRSVSLEQRRQRVLSANSPRASASSSAADARVLGFIVIAIGIFIICGSTESDAKQRSRRCCGPFCTSSRIDLQDRQNTGKERAEIERRIQKTLDRYHTPIERCVVDGRRRDPEMRTALIEFVLDKHGRVLATRVNGRRRSLLAQCIHRNLRRARFKLRLSQRTIVGYSVKVLH